MTQPPPLSGLSRIAGRTVEGDYLIDKPESKSQVQVQPVQNSKFYGSNLKRDSPKYVGPPTQVTHQKTLLNRLSSSDWASY